MRRVVYRVLPRPDFGWRIARSGRVISSWPRKNLAVKAARKSARLDAPSQLVIHGRDGRIQTEHTYGADPERFPG